MDNVCHTLVGAALAEAGLKRKTAFGTATLMIAANFPDIDVIAVPLGHSLGFRRGVTHGAPALVISPIVLTLIVLAWHRWRRPQAEPSTGWLVILSTIGILTHPFLDWMNSYGMRWLMPISGAWWYADTLFIVDPWIWLALGAGVWVARRRGRALPARSALAFVAVYIAAMGLLTSISRRGVRAALTGQGVTADTVVVEPVPANPFSRRVIYNWQGSYHVATYAVANAKLSTPWFTIALNDGHPAVALANQTPQGREYHSWARLPYYVIEETKDTAWVTIADARYTLDGQSSWAVTRIPIPGHTVNSEKH
jgi:inner membrane protein